MFAPVWQRVVCNNYRTSIAILENHARYAVRGVGYPGVIAEAGASVEGVLYFDVAEEDLARLDAFEGSEYRRDAVTVRALGVDLGAHTYIFLEPAALLDTGWSPQTFDLPHFMASYCSMRGVA